MSSLLDAIALGAAEKIWKTAGPRAGLIAYRNLLSQDADATRATAILRGMDCAMEAGDEQAAFSFAESWGFVLRGDHADDVVRSAARLSARGFLRTAHLLLSREHERRHAPLVAYVLGKVSAQRGLPGDALAAFEACVETGRAAGKKLPAQVAALVAAATVEVARTRAREPETATLALELARKVDATLLLPRQRLELARLLLMSKSRFERAGAISQMVDVARLTPGLAPRAARYAAAHADRTGHSLTPLEADRVKAALACHPDASCAALAATRLESLRNAVGTAAALAEERRIMVDPELAPLVVKAKAVLAGGSGPPAADTATPHVRLTCASLAAIAQLRRGALDTVTLGKVRDLASADVRPFPRAALTLAWLALASKDRTLHPAASELCGRALSLHVATPRGLLPLAALLAERGQDELAQKALRLAVLRDEPNAGERLERLLVTRAKSALARGDRASAMSLLSEARGRNLSK